LISSIDHKVIGKLRHCLKPEFPRAFDGFQNDFIALFGDFNFLALQPKFLG
jgi:hypothetical protein